jgi:putative ABC transport system ATP-binding protein
MALKPFKSVLYGWVATVSENVIQKLLILPELGKMMVEPLIELRDVRKSYPMGDHEIRALCGVDLSIDKGDFISILGPSGSGKSTLLHLVALLDKPTSGKISLQGKDVTTLSSEELAQARNRDIGIVFQFFFLSSFLTAKENVELPMMFSETSAAERVKRARELLKSLGIEKRESSKPSQLSGGERQRVAIARALANRPLLVLADEPTGNLDSKTGEEIVNILKKLNKEGNTIVVVTHDESIAKKTRKVIYLLDGKIEKVVKRK